MPLIQFGKQQPWNKYTLSENSPKAQGCAVSPALWPLKPSVSLSQPGSLLLNHRNVRLPIRATQQFFFPSTYTSQHRRREITGVSDWRFVLHDTGCQKKRKNSLTKSAEGCLQSLDTHINIHLCTVTVTFPCFSLFSLPLSDCPPLSFPRSLSSLGKIMMTKNRSHWQCSHGPAGDYSVLTKANNKYSLQEQQVSDKIVSL